jgi:diaminopimelate epimerase
MIPFVKAHACGNDFLIIEEPLAQRRHAELARKLCARNTSVGADGIEFLDRKANGEFFLRLFNADGSEAELSGNGTRCVAAWLASSEGRHSVVLGTHGGLRTCHVVEAADPTYLIESEMGVPRVMQRTIELPGVGNVAGAMVNVGNPHFVLFVDTDDFSAHCHAWQELGALSLCASCRPLRLPSGFMSGAAARPHLPALARVPRPQRRWLYAAQSANLLRLRRVARNVRCGSRATL